MKNSIEITTPRLLLRTPIMADLEMIQSAKEAVWPQLQSWMSWATDEQKPMEALRTNFINRAVDNHSVIGLCHQTRRFVVSSGLTPNERHAGQYETGYWVAKEFLGLGYATEAANAVSRYGFGVLAADSVYICHYEGNEPSRRVIEKLGFTKTGVVRNAYARYTDGTLLDKHEYIMTDPRVLPPLDVRW